MVEVFKTNVADDNTADHLVDQIHRKFDGYHANFDLEDCDLILRVENFSGDVEAFQITDLVKENGFEAEILVDELIG
jgi:hypothetical protein